MATEIDQQTFAREIEREGAYVLDVREPDEYRSGHVPGAVNIPLGVLPVRMGDVPADRTALIVCQAGGRSAQATDLLVAAGRRAVSVAGGTGAWVEAGHRVVTGADAGVRS